MGRDAVVAQLAVDATRRPARWVWVYHWPPVGSPTCWNGRRHYGDADLAGWIDTYRPDVVLTGHVHEPPSGPMEGGRTGSATHGCSMPVARSEASQRTPRSIWARAQRPGGPTPAPRRSTSRAAAHRRARCSDQWCRSVVGLCVASRTWTSRRTLLLSQLHQHDAGYDAGRERRMNVASARVSGGDGTRRGSRRRTGRVPRTQRSGRRDRARSSGGCRCRPGLPTGATSA